MTDGYKTQTKQQILDQSIEVVRRRIDAMGTKEPDIARQGDDRILVQVPGLQDPAAAQGHPGQNRQDDVPAGGRDRRSRPRACRRSATKSCPDGVDPKQVLPPIIVQRRVMVSGDRLTDAGAGFDSRPASRW